MIKHGFSSEIFNLIIISPILKDNRLKKTDSNNYRAIALNSFFSKLLDYIFLEYFENVFKSDNQQFAYKKDHSTTTCAFIAMECIQYYRNRDSNVFLAALDCSKAFDMVRYRKLFKLLIGRNLCPLVVRFLLLSYLSIEAKVMWRGCYSKSFKIFNGVKQSGVLSPVLFSIYIDELIKMVRNTGAGCFVGSKCCSILVYADDILLLAPTVTALRKLMAKCEEYSNIYSISFNPQKSNIAVFGNLKSDFRIEFFGHLIEKKKR